MEGYPPFIGAKLSSSNVNKIKRYFKWSMFTEGDAIVSETRTGGVHYTGSKTRRKAVSFEVIRKNTYVVIVLFEYKKGVIFHTHIFFPQVSKRSSSILELITTGLYNEVKNLLLP